MKTLTQKLLALFALCAMLVVTTTACGADQSSTTSDPADNSVTITPAPHQRVDIETHESIDATDQLSEAMKTTNDSVPNEPGVEDDLAANEPRFPTPRSSKIDPTPRSPQPNIPPKSTPTTAEATKRPPTVAEVINDYLDGTARLSDFYTVQDDGWLALKGAVRTGLRYDYLYPTAVFPEVDWTPESVIASYQDQTAPWVDDPYQISLDDNCQSLWSADYQDHFVVEGSWLKINGAYSVPFDCTTVPDITPQALLEAYQSGKWDGNEKLWSADYSTNVCIGYTGSLHYSYANPVHICAEEVRQYAYTGCNDAPWWYNTNDGSIWHKYQGFTLESYSNYHTGNECHYCNARIACYPDLPNGTLDPSLGQIIDIQHNDDGTWITTTTGIYHFLEGKLVDQWELKLDEGKSFVMLYQPDNYNFDASYAYTGDQLVKLLPNGKVSRILSGHIYAATSYEGSFWAYYVQDHNLIYWRNYNGEISTSIVVDGDVVDLKDAGNAFFFTMEDGYTYAAYGRNREFQPTCIGRISLEACAEEWLDPNVDHATFEWLADKYASTITDAPLLTNTAE